MTGHVGVGLGLLEIGSSALLVMAGKDKVRDRIKLTSLICQSYLFIYLALRSGPQPTYSINNPKSARDAHDEKGDYRNGSFD